MHNYSLIFINEINDTLYVLIIKVSALYKNGLNLASFGFTKEVLSYNCDSTGIQGLLFNTETCLVDTGISTVKICEKTSSNVQRLAKD